MVPDGSALSSSSSLHSSSLRSVLSSPSSPYVPKAEGVYHSVSVTRVKVRAITSLTVHLMLRHCLGVFLCSHV